MWTYERAKEWRKPEDVRDGQKVQSTVYSLMLIQQVVEKKIIKFER